MNGDCKTCPMKIPEEVLRKHGGKIRLEFHRGLKGIAEFLGVHERTVQDYIKRGTWPIKRDPAGTWVLCNVDYYLSLQAMNTGGLLDLFERNGKPHASGH